MEEKTIEREVIYEGKIFNVEKHVVSLPNGGTSVRELVYHNGAVAVLVVDEDDRIVLVEQYRKAFESMSLEIPAGKLEVGLTAGTMNLDEDEFLQVLRFTFDEAVDLLVSGRITDAKTIMAIQWWQLSKLK